MDGLKWTCLVKSMSFWIAFTNRLSALSLPNLSVCNSRSDVCSTQTLFTRTCLFCKKKRRHLPWFVPFFYTQMENSPLKTILSKNSDQRFWKTLVASLHVNWEKLCLGQPTSQYAPQLHIFIWDSDLLMLAWASRYTSSSIVNEDFSENWQMCTMLFSKSVRLKW